jgi:hypothetical protein
VLPVSEPSVAVTVAEPALSAEDAPELKTFSTLAVSEAKVTVPDGGCIVESLQTSTAVNCADPPTGSDGADGLTFSDTGPTATVRLKLLLASVPNVALIFVLPAATLVATAGLADADAGIVAIAGLDELQATDVVMSTAPGFPVAVQLDVRPIDTLAGVQLTTIAVSVCLTVSIAVAEAPR